jgi:hypothetical protein
MHYPNFNVMDEEKQWDLHTRKIVGKRTDTQSFYSLQYLTEQESNTLFELCAILLDDERNPIISFIVHHFDSTLAASIGESQRKDGVPKQTILLREGLALLEKACSDVYGGSFGSLKEETKTEVVNNLMHGNFTLKSDQITIPEKDFIHNISSEATAAYYSHPTIWSEIGYAGPAYPRGYVRTELGLTDPWEARQDGK